MSPNQAKDVLTHGIPSSAADYLIWTNYAAALYVTGRDEEALEAAQQAVTLQRAPVALLNLGIILEAFGRFSDALALFAEANGRDKDSTLAGAAYADALVRLGRWREGWPLYAYYHAMIGTSMRIPSIDEIRDKRILVTDNGGMGDAVYHLRWLGRLKEHGCHITYAGPASRLSAFENHPWIDRLLASPAERPLIEWHTSGEPSYVNNESYCLNLNDFDFFMSNMTVPAVLKVKRDASIWPGAYLIAPKRSRISRWAEHFAVRGQVGLCWRAGESRFPRPHRTLRQGQLERLVDAGKKLELVSLSPEAITPKGVQGYPLGNWKSTVRLIDRLDLVVTVDTGVAHLAGAMGKNVMVMLPAASAWPYGLGDDHRLAYPTMRCFRNVGPGIDGAVDACCAALEKM